MSVEPTSQKIELTFRKGEAARFLSHLDLMATLEYAVRRARLPIELSTGFNPRQRLSVAAPLAVGYTGENELLEVTLRESMDPAEVRRKLQNALPAGIEMLHARIAPAGLKTAASRLAGAVYRVEFDRAVPDLDERVTQFLRRDKIEIEEERDGKMRTRDIRPFVEELHAGGEDTVLMTLRTSDAGGLRPEVVVETLVGAGQCRRIVRERLIVNEHS